MTASLRELCEKNKVQYVAVSFVDVAGVMRSKLVPKAAADMIQQDGAGFAGFATYLDMTPADGDTLVMPDSNTFQVMPFKPEVAWVTGDVMIDGKLVDHAPRNVLKRMQGHLKSAGYSMMTGVEAEFFVLSADGKSLADQKDVAAKPCYDQLALMRNYPLIAEICDSMLAMGWEPYQNDHEDANGQFEMNWKYAETLTTADRHAFFKFMARAIAEKNGQRITFMPKPFSQLTGNGCHAHVSLWSVDGKKNMFEDSSGELGLSALGYNFIGGVLENAQALCALTNPTVNSYKRLNSQRTVSGSTWSPQTVSFAGNNRTHLIRIPGPGRFELRLPDGSANPYLLQAGLLASGLDGIKRKISPGSRSDKNTYTERDAVKAVSLPRSLSDSLNELEKNVIFKELLGKSFVESYLKLKKADWDAYSCQVSDWERETTLDI